MKHIDFVLVGNGREPRPAEQRFVIEQFELRGFSSHSVQGFFVPTIVKHCQEKRIPFTLSYYPGGGYSIKREPFNRAAAGPLDDEGSGEAS